MHERETVETIRGLLRVIAKIEERYLPGKADFFAAWQHLDCDPKDCEISRGLKLIKRLEKRRRVRIRLGRTA